MIFTHGLPTPMDLNTASFLETCKRLGESPSNVALFVSEMNWGVAKLIRQEHGCFLVEIPAGILANKFVWCVRSHDNRVVYSHPTA